MLLEPLPGALPLTHSPEGGSQRCRVPTPRLLDVEAGWPWVAIVSVPIPVHSDVIKQQLQGEVSSGCQSGVVRERLCHLVVSWVAALGFLGPLPVFSRPVELRRLVVLSESVRRGGQDKELDMQTATVVSQPRALVQRHEGDTSTLRVSLHIERV